MNQEHSRAKTLGVGTVGYLGTPHAFLNLAELPLQLLFYLHNNAPPVLAQADIPVQAGYFCACVLVCHEHASLLLLLNSQFAFACLCWPIHGTLCIQQESPKTVHHKQGEACNRVCFI